jgi:hypothetical protein
LSLALQKQLEAEAALGYERGVFTFLDPIFDILVLAVFRNHLCRFDPVFIDR